MDKEQLERDVKRIAAAFGVSTYDSIMSPCSLKYQGVGRGGFMVTWEWVFELSEDWEFEVNHVGSKWGFGCRVTKDIEHMTEYEVEQIVEADEELPWTWLPDPEFDHIMTCGLFCFGVDVSQLYCPLSHHEQLELRDQMPRELWPDSWH